MDLTFASLTVIALCGLALACCIGAAFQIAERRGWVSPLAVGAIAAAMAVVCLGVWAVWASFDDAGAAPLCSVYQRADGVLVVNDPPAIDGCDGINLAGNAGPRQVVEK